MSDKSATLETPAVQPSALVIPSVQTGAEVLAAALVKAHEEKAKALAAIPPKALEPVLQLHYDILVDHITGESPNVHEQNVMVLKGRVTEGDLRRAGVDLEWLKRIESIQEAGYHLA